MTAYVVHDSAGNVIRSGSCSIPADAARAAVASTESVLILEPGVVPTRVASVDITKTPPAPVMKAAPTVRQPAAAPSH